MAKFQHSHASNLESGRQVSGRPGAARRLLKYPAMTTSKILLASASILIATTATASAQAVPAAAAQVAPAPAVAPAQTHDWNDVSHINGQLVQVGEQNSYLKSFRRFNLSTNPVGWMLGFYGVSASYAVHQHIALRADANLFRPIESDAVGIEVGFGVPLYLRRAYQGPFVEPGVVIRSIDEGDCDKHSVNCEDVDTLVGSQMLMGWHWTWESGFNLAAAAGAGRRLEGSDPSDDKLFFNGYLRVGYAF